MERRGTCQWYEILNSSVTPQTVESWDRKSLGPLHPTVWYATVGLMSGSNLWHVGDSFCFVFIHHNHMIHHHPLVHTWKRTKSFLEFSIVLLFSDFEFCSRCTWIRLVWFRGNSRIKLLSMILSVIHDSKTLRIMSGLKVRYYGPNQTNLWDLRRDLSSFPWFQFNAWTENDWNAHPPFQIGPLFLIFECLKIFVFLENK